MDNEQKITKIINQSSLEVSKNSRGWTYSVKVYGDSNEEIEVKTKELLSIARNIIKQQEILLVKQ